MKSFQPGEEPDRKVSRPQKHGWKRFRVASGGVMTSLRRFPIAGIRFGHSSAMSGE
jgi:hypothetical protein